MSVDVEDPGGLVSSRQELQAFSQLINIHSGLSEHCPTVAHCSHSRSLGCEFSQGPCRKLNAVVEGAGEPVIAEVETVAGGPVSVTTGQELQAFSQLINIHSRLSEHCPTVAHCSHSTSLGCEFSQGPCRKLNAVVEGAGEPVIAEVETVAGGPVSVTTGQELQAFSQLINIHSGLSEHCPTVDHCSHSRSLGCEFSHGACGKLNAVVEGAGELVDVMPGHALQVF